MWQARAGLAGVILLFCLPLFLGLRQWDMRNDEAIYSYAVDRILETGEWLTPRSIPTDEPFLEKPPLKFWLVAGAIRIGLLPFDERGMRAIDALFGALAFVYIYAIGRRLAGTVAGLVAVFIVFSFDLLLFEHGVRGNNMEATLLLAYTGGVYHFVQWAESLDPRKRRQHAYAIAGWFTLAFMTKFVAALFLPIVCAVALLLKSGGLRYARLTWRDWIGPALASALAVAPWFIYQSLHAGAEFWHVIFTTHVYQRFAATLAPEHLRPWHHYFTQTGIELWLSGVLPVCLAGVAVMFYLGWRQRDWLARLVCVWWTVPFVLMSLGTSKLFYYTYPFFPPLALGAGVAAALFVRESKSERIAALAARFHYGGFDRRRGTAVGRALVAFGAVAFAVAAWTRVFGRVEIVVGGVHVFRNSVLLRPVLLGMLAWYLGGFGRLLLGPVAILALGSSVFLPLRAYPRTLERLTSVDHPLRTARDCALRLEADAAVGKGVYLASGDLHHAYYYYLRRLPPWIPPEAAGPAELRRRLEVEGQQTPVILSKADYVKLGGRLPSTAAPVPNELAGSGTLPGAAALRNELPPGVLLYDYVVMLFPGPLGACVAPVAEAGAWTSTLPAARDHRIRPE